MDPAPKMKGVAEASSTSFLVGLLELSLPLAAGRTADFRQPGSGWLWGEQS
jgi:hypothetical protein